MRRARSRRVLDRRASGYCWSEAPSSVIRGVTKIMRSRRFSVSVVLLKSLPTIGRLPRSGMPDRIRVTSVTVRPPMTAVSPSFDEELVVGLLLREGEAEVGRGQGPDRRPLGVELHQHLAVVRHVRRDGEADTGLLELHRGAGAAPLPVEFASITRTGVSSPTRMSAWRLSSVEMTGSAWTSASSVRSSALRNVVSAKPPMLVE